MRALLFYAGKSCFSIDCLHVERVVPFLDFEPITTASACVVGLLQVEKNIVPVVDFCQLLEKRPTDFLLSSRVIIVKDPHLRESSEPQQFLGILAEKVYELAKIEDRCLVGVDFHPYLYPFLSKVVVKNDKMIHDLDLSLFFDFVLRDFK